MTLKSIFPLLFILFTANLFSTDLYWIGKTGNWHEPANWSYASGGTSANVLPTAKDDVFFDEKSFTEANQTVYFGVVSVTSITVTSPNYPVYEGQELTVLKGIDFQSVIAFRGDIVCNNLTEGSINTGGYILSANISIVAGNWNLNNHLILGDDNSLVISCNKFKANKYTLKAGEIIAKNVKLDASNATVHAVSKIDLTEALKKGGDINLINSNGGPDFKLGAWSGANITTRATCGTLTVNTSVTSNYNGSQISCNNACDAEITVTLSGTSTGPFGYSLNNSGGPFQSSNVLTGVCAGLQTVFVIDSSQQIAANNYVICDEDFNPSQPSALSFTLLSITNPSCPEICDGEAVIQIDTSDGTGAIAVLWGSGETDTNAVMLCTGSNSLTLTDDNNCTVNGSIVINAPIPIEYDINVTGVTCNGDSDATVSILNETGGNGAPYTFSYSPSPTTGQNTANGVGFSAGNITVTVTDVDGCTQDSTIAIIDPPVFTAGFADIINLECFEACIGQISAVPAGGVPGYIYEWFDNATGLSTGITDSIATGLCAGDYFVQITDANGCVKISPVATVAEPAEITLNLTKTDLACIDVCTGAASVTVNGGTPGYTFNWTNITTAVPQGTAASISALCPGEYEVQVLDANNCPAEPDTIEILNGLPLDVVLTSTPPSCYDICDGEITATPTNGTGFTYSWSNGDNGATINGLCVQGNYIVTVTSDSGCVEMDSLVFATPVIYDVVVSQNDLLCFGDTDGNIAVEVIEGGNGPVHTFDWTVVSSPGTAINGDLTDSIFDLTALTYELVITDGPGGCDTTMSFTITSPPELTITAVNPIDLLCGDVCDGEMSALPVGGALPYTYEWFDNATGLTTGITDSTATGLCEGDYFVVVTDNNNCTATSAPTSINAPPLLMLSLSNTDLTCIDICDGTATSTVTGGTPNYTYSWVNLTTNTNAGTTPNLAGLCPGDYELTLSDANNCPAVVDTITILNALPIDVTLLPSDPTCFNVCDGQIVATATNSSGFSYVWTPGTIAGQGTNTATGLCADINYVVEVTDVNGCIERDSVTLNSVPPYQIDTTVTDVTCFGDADGMITVTVNAGGSGTPYTFTWVSVNGNAFSGQGTNTITNLLPGDYTLTVSDAISCDTVLNFTVQSPPELIVGVADLQQITCFGVCDGQISAAHTGGTPGYLIEWIDNPTNLVISNDSILQNLCAGDYYLRVTDVNGCKDSSAVLTIIEPAPLNVTLGATNISCFGVCDGTAQATVAGGTPTFSYVWTNLTNNSTVGSNSSISGLCPGEYQVVITDGTGCITPPDTVEVLDVLPFEVDLTGTDPTCTNLCNGTISGTTTNGSAPFMWSNTPSSGQNTAFAGYTNLCDGFYAISVEDNNGCIAQDTITLNEPMPYDITVTETDLTCFGDNSGTIAAVVNAGGNGGPYTYSWLPPGLTGSGTNTVTNLNQGAYQVLISDGTCDTTLQFNIDEPEELLIDATVISQPFCEGDCSGSGEVTISGGTPNYTIQWNDPSSQSTAVVTGLCEDTYQVLVTDANGCFTSDSIVIIESLGFTLSTSSTDVDCFGDCNGTATVSGISGGTPNYTIQWNDPNNQTTLTATNLCPGTYQATITDANNCDTIVSVTINEPMPITFTTEVGDTACYNTCDGEVIANAAGGQGPYIFEWFNTNSNVSIGNGATLSNLCAGNYYAEITDASGCSILTDTLEIVEFNEINLALASFTDETCGNADGDISITAAGGAGGFSYVWTPGTITGQGTANITQLEGGLYQVLVTDANNCTDSLSVPINGGASETLTTSSTDVSCFGLADGSVSVNFICNDPACNITWFNESGAVIGTTNTVNGLIGGTYYVELVNDLGCSTIDSVSISEPLEIEASISSTNLVCNGVATGTATVTANLSNLIYSWTPQPTGGQGTNQAVGLSAGLMTVEISDISGCAISLTTNITEPLPIIIDTLVAQDISCGGVIDGSVYVSASGGSVSLSYEWFSCGTGVSIGTGSSINNVVAGDYFVVITDGNNCAISSTCVTVQDFTPITAINIATNVTCFGNCNGTIMSSVSGGNGNYFYQWKDANQADLVGQTNANIINLCQGTYYLEVTDGNGCSELFGPIDLTQPSQPWDISINVTDVTCFSECDGTGTVTVNSGNTAPYFYSWNDPINQSVSQAINLCAGNYEVLITDQSNCDTTVQVLITEPLPINPNAIQTNILCADDCDGEVTLAPSGGQAPYGINWSNGDMGLVATNLCAGPITANIIDNAGCTIDPTFNITEPLSPISISSSFQNISECNECNGSATVNVVGGTLPYTFVWSEPTVTGQGTNNATDLCSGFISVTVTDANGCSIVQSFLIEDVDGDAFTLTNTDASCFDICDGEATIVPTCTVLTCTQMWYNAGTGVALPDVGTTVTGLCAGDYIVQLTNGAGCVSGDTFSIASPDELILDGLITDVSCSGFADGAIVATVSGGSGAGYTYNWTPIPPNGNGTNSATTLSAGTYDLQVTDGLNCIIQDAYTVIDTTPITLTATSNNVTCNGFCNGNMTVIANGGFGNYTYQWLNNGTPIPGETGNSIFNLCPGSYNVVVTDGNGCSQTLINPIIITEPSQVAALVTTTDITCFGLCDGTATASGSGGVGPFIYNWYNSSNNLIGQPSSTATNLCPDSYYAVITDANNCSVNTSIAAVVEPAELVFTIAQNNISCFDECDASATITVNGGNPDYIYNWIDLSTNTSISTDSTIANICAGGYTVDVSDQNGCSIDVQTVNIATPAVLTANVLVNNAECNVPSGSISLQVSGGIPVYTYQWLDETQTVIAGETNASLQGVFSGTYFAVVADANGCDDTLVAVVDENPNTTLQFDAVNNPTCFNGADGSISITVIGNNPPLSYLWNAGGIVVEDPTNLAAGTYNLTVTDALGCESFYDTVLINPTEITKTPTIVDPLCGECDGSVDVSVVGGDSPYTFNWNTGATTNDIQNLCGGIYELTIEDANGCEITTQYPLANSASVTAETNVIPISCFDLCDGEITVNILTGTAPFTVTWLNDGFVGLTRTNLCAGTYFIEVADADGCIFPMVVELENPNEILATAEMILPNCGATDGEIAVTSTGGVLPHVYSWSTSQSTPTISGVGEGIYILTITDNGGTGCSQDFTFNLSNLNVPQVALAPTDINCNGDCDGEISTTTTGGTPNYSYQWFTNDGTLLVGESSSTITNLCAGNYSVEVTDANGCVAFATTIINEPTPIIFNTPFSEDVSCFNDCDGEITVNSFGGTLPYTFQWDDPSNQTTTAASNLCEGTYVITLTDGNGCVTTYTDSITQPDELAVVLDTIIEARCKETLDGSIQSTITGGTLNYNITWTAATGQTFNTEDLVDVLPMDYFLTVVDANGCTVQDTALIDTATVVFVDAGLDTVICHLEEANLLATSNQTAATYNWLDGLGDIVGNTNTYLTGSLPEGIYTFVAQATFNDCDDFDTVLVTVNSPLLVDAGPDIEIGVTGTATIGGDPTSTSTGQFAWSPPIYLSDTTVSNPDIIKPQEDTWYYVTITDSLGCTAIDSMYVEVIPELTVPEGISPNNDGKNDTWIIAFNEDFPNLEVSVYNRWGELLFYDNTGYQTPWDGTYKGKELPVGTYYYVVNLNTELYPEPFIGPLTILR